MIDVVVTMLVWQVVVVLLAVLRLIRLELVEVDKLEFNNVTKPEPVLEIGVVVVLV